LVVRIDDSHVCSIEEIKSSFDGDGVIADEALLCNVVSRWVEDNTSKLTTAEKGD